MATSTLPEPFRRWFATRGWEPRAHQIALLEKARAGRSTLLIAPTGAGKTLAGFLPTLVELAARSARSSVGRGALASGSGLHTLYVSRLKALAVDIARNQTHATATLPARHPAHHARAGRAAAVDRRRALSVCDPQAHCAR